MHRRLVLCFEIDTRYPSASHNVGITKQNTCPQPFWNQMRSHHAKIAAPMESNAYTSPPPGPGGRGEGYTDESNGLRPWSSFSTTTIPSPLISSSTSVNSALTSS